MGTDRKKNTSHQMENHVPSIKHQVWDWSEQREFLRSVPSLERMFLSPSLICPRVGVNEQIIQNPHYVEVYAVG